MDVLLGCNLQWVLSKNLSRIFRLLVAEAPLVRHCAEIKNILANENGVK